jgi:hypothetical protein
MNFAPAYVLITGSPYAIEVLARLRQKGTPWF